MKNQSEQLIEEVQRLLSEPIKGPAESADSTAGLEIEHRLDRLEFRGGPSGVPSGVPLKDSLRQVFLTKRPEWYKTKVSDQYLAATGQVRKLYGAIDGGEALTASEVKAVAGTFLTLLKNDRNILLNLANMPSSEGDFLYTHAINTSLLSMAIAGSCGYSEEQAMEIVCAALLVDVGMMRVPEAVRNKAGTLDKDELYEIHKHPTMGADLIGSIPDLSPFSILSIYQHHERLSGTGYPRQRSGHLIHDYSRIIAIADTYAAMVANRSYRRRLIPYQAMESILKMGSKGLLDPRLIRRFLDTMSLIPVGSVVRLKSGRIGKIIQSNEGDYSKPVVAILFHADDRAALAGTVVDLAKDPEDSIHQALDPDAIPQGPMDGF